MKNWFWQNAQGLTSEASALADLIDAVKRGEIGPSTQVSNDGENWKSAEDVPALADALELDVAPTSGAEPASEDADSTPPKKKRSGCAVVGGVCCVLLIVVALGFRFIGVETARRALLASDWGRRVLLESERGRRTICANNLEKVALGVQIYGSFNEVLPPAYTVDAEGKPLHSWRVLILPYLGEEAAALYEQIRLDEPWDSEWNARFHARAPGVFVCPSFGAALPDGAPVAETTYSVVVGDETAFPSAGNWRKWVDFTDGLSQTLCVVERKTPVCWMEPTRELTLETLAAEVGSGHKTGFNAAFFDGCVRLVESTTTDAAKLNAWATVAGDEETPEF